MTEKQKEEYNKYRWFLTQVEPYDDFEVDDYYGIQFMKVKRNSTYDIRLQYDYESHPKNGTSFKVETIEEVIEWILIMEGYAKDKSTVRKAKKYNPNKAIDYTKPKLKTKDELKEEAKKQEWE